MMIFVICTWAYDIVCISPHVPQNVLNGVSSGDVLVLETWVGKVRLFLASNSGCLSGEFIQLRYFLFQESTDHALDDHALCNKIRI